MKTKQAALQFLAKLNEYELNITKINGDVCDGLNDELINNLTKIGDSTITIQINEKSYDIKLSVDDDTALVVYDYHPVFDDIAEDIRQYQKIVDHE